uniref:cytochrome P450 736A117-like n=1 Tax=Erigeron canadensis TaxID=72917 RepID=UPI001CB94697|nr:cytochrome P450 736A117-like [Erigeron canadensis]
MANPLIYIVLFFSLLLPFLSKLYSIISSPTTSNKNRPPSPPKLPIIGNLHQIGPLVHHSLFSLSQRYGRDLMLVYMGSIPTLVVSSPDSAREIMQTHDLTFASRAPLYVYKTLFYDSKEIATAPYGVYWRQAKKILVHHFLSNKKLKRFSGLIDRETAITMRNVVENATACNKQGVISLGEMLSQHVSSVLYKTTFGKLHDDEEMGKKFKMVSKDLSKVFATLYIVGFIPQLGWIDVIRGAPSKAKGLAKNIDKLLEIAIEEKVVKVKDDDHHHEVVSEGEEPLIDTLLRLHKDGSIGCLLERDAVKALLMDSYLGGLESTSALLEWAMAELLRHPSALKKVQAEIRMVVNYGSSRQHIITDEDIKQMKDHKVWVDRPNEFVPERFLASSMDFVKQHDFKLLPFGAGRRMCPGEGLALTIAENLLANLLCKFDWALPEGDMDMNERTGLATHKKTKLLAFAKPHLDNS